MALPHRIVAAQPAVPDVVPAGRAPGAGRGDRVACKRGGVSRLSAGGQQAVNRLTMGCQRGSDAGVRPQVRCTASPGARSNRMLGLEGRRVGGTEGWRVGGSEGYVSLRVTRVGGLRAARVGGLRGCGVAGLQTPHLSSPMVSWRILTKPPCQVPHVAPTLLYGGQVVGPAVVRAGVAGRSEDGRGGGRRSDEYRRGCWHDTATPLELCFWGIKEMDPP